MKAEHAKEIQDFQMKLDGLRREAEKRELLDGIESLVGGIEGLTTEALTDEDKLQALELAKNNQVREINPFALGTILSFGQRF